MARSSDRGSRDDGTDDVTGVALGVSQDGGDWQIARLTPSALTSLEDAARQVRSLRGPRSAWWTWTTSSL